MVSDNYLPRTPRHWASHGRSIYRVPRAKHSTRSSSPFFPVFLLFPLLVFLFLSLDLLLSLFFLSLLLQLGCFSFSLVSVSTVSFEIGSNVMIIPVLRPWIRSFRGIRISFESHRRSESQHYPTYSYNFRVSLTNNYKYRI